MDKTYIGLSKKISYVLCYLIPLFGLVFVLKKDEERETRYIGAQGVIIYVSGLVLSVSQWLVSFIPIVSVIIGSIIGIVLFCIGLGVIYLVYCVVTDKDTKIELLEPLVDAVLDTF